jgi:LL-diaminopimelate aminotransferase
MPQLTQAVIDWYKRRYNVNLSADEITSVNGSQEGLTHIAMPLCDPGDIVLAPNPGYPIFSLGPMLCGANIVEFPLYEKNNFLVDFDDIPEDTAKAAKIIVVSYPANPVTALANKNFYERLVAFAKKI